MDKEIIAIRRKSYIAIGEIFFWTATINNWQRLLLKDEYKKVIINSLTHLSDLGKIDVFGFVIMPNHLHLIWRINETNGKETSQGSFLKYTAHEFKKMLKTDKDNSLSSYSVDAHNNPCTEYWHLAKEPADYLFSSAKYYETGIKDFAFLKDLRDEL